MPEQNILASKDAEQSVLGAVFYDESTIKLIIDKLQSTDFYYLRHQNIYDTMVELYKQKTPIDSTTVISHLEDLGKLNECGGAEYIMELVEAVPSISNLETYITLVKDKSVQRNVVAACNSIIKDSNEPEKISDPKAFLDSVEKRIFDCTKERTAGAFVPIRSVLKEVYEKIESNAQKEGTVTGYDTGYHKLNKLTLGFQNSDLIILAARPSMGKTALALNLACNVASLKERPYVAFFSLEMSLDQLALRLISQKSNIDQNELKTGKFYDPQAWNKINYAINELQDLNLMFDDSGTSTVQELRSLCRKKKSEGKLDFVVIDYLQLLSTTSKATNEVQMLSEISRALKEMAKELNIPVLALSQLSRSLEQRTDKTPIMSDLRGSGSIEQDADVCMFIHREAYYKKNDPTIANQALLLVRKNRNGMTGDVDLIFKGGCTNFIDVDERDDEEEY